MKKLLILALAALFAFTSCEKSEKSEKKVIGNGEIVCDPITMTVKVGETKSFTFTQTSDRKFSDADPLCWNAVNFDGTTGGVAYEYMENNTVNVTGEKEGVVTVIAYVYLDEANMLVLGGSEVTVTK